MELYVDGLHSDRRIPRLKDVPDSPWFDTTDLSEIPVQQYVAIPGMGRVDGSKSKTNPALLAGDLTRTRTRMAYRRKETSRPTSGPSRSSTVIPTIRPG